MKNSILGLLLLLLIVSCDKDDPKPEILSFELGYHNSKIAIVGADLHIDADIIALNRIDYIEIEIHRESGEHKSTLLKSTYSGWEFEHKYIKFSGLKNTSFHEHIEIPIDAQLGNYHFHLKVVDMKGFMAEVLDEFEITYPYETDAVK